MHFFKLSISDLRKLEPETSAYFEEIGLNKEILNFELLKMKSSFSADFYVNYVTFCFLEMDKKTFLQLMELMTNELE